jgi:predicted ATP-grasp superfamily ATP-dependent carboligase
MSKLLGGQYEGYFGIDMMIYDDNGTMMIAPCVEVNLRMTMGVVAHRLMERVVAPGLHARMRVEHHGLTAYEKANVDGQRLTGGTISLVPPNSHFSITLEIIKSS